MFEFKSYLNLANGQKQEQHIRIKTQVVDGVNAIFIDAFSREMIDSEFGAAIEFSIENLKGWMADYRHSEYWCRPEFGEKLEDIPNETQGLIYEKTDGTFGAILPVVSEQYKCVLAGGPENNIQARLFSWKEKLHSCKALAFLCAEGKSPYHLMEKCAEVGLNLLNTGCRTRKERRYPELFEYLGWCSWDAFEIRVDEKSLLEKCQEFKDKQIPVKWAIIDDMWAEVRDFYDMKYSNRKEMLRLMKASKLYSFKADPRRFPNGLRDCINKMKEYGLKVGMWHPTTGYWVGIDPEGEIFRDYKECLIETEDGRYIHSYEQGKAYQFYNAFHEYLRKCGAEFIKIDNQSMTRRYYKKLTTVGDATRQFHGAMEASVGQHFDNQMINCMGMANEDMWNRSVSPISRCSDDFLPEDKAWFTKHVLQCAYNCLIQGQFYYCDWDMWWTDDGQAEKNSLIRAISGGPIYVSDTLDRSRAEVLEPLIFTDGRILRCDRPGVPSKDCITQNPTTSGKIFKLQNICNDSGVLAVFNLDGEDNMVSGEISPMDIDGLQGEKFVVYEHFSREFKVLCRTEKLEVILNNRDEYKLYVFVPIVEEYAMIGRIDKYISPKTVRFNSKGEAELIEVGPYAYYQNGQVYFVNGK